MPPRNQRPDHDWPFPARDDLTGSGTREKQRNHGDETTDERCPREGAAPADHGAGDDRPAREPATVQLLPRCRGRRSRPCQRGQPCAQAARRGGELPAARQWRHAARLPPRGSRGRRRRRRAASDDRGDERAWLRCRDRGQPRFQLRAGLPADRLADAAFPVVLANLDRPDGDSLLPRSCLLDAGFTAEDGTPQRYASVFWASRRRRSRNGMHGCWRGTCAPARSLPVREPRPPACATGAPTS